MYKVDLEKAEGSEKKIANIFWIIEKSKTIPNKNTSISASLTTLKPLTVWMTTNWNILEEMRIPDHLTCLLRNLYLEQEEAESYMEQLTGSKLGKGYTKVYCYCAYLTYMQSTSCEIPGWMKHKLESRLLGEISILRYTDAAATAESLQSCPTLCDPIDASPPGSPVPGILQARTLEWLAISFSNARK